jgi:hypothetical protein
MRFVAARASRRVYAVFMQSERNFLRALPRKFCSSAFIEHAFAFSLFGVNGRARFTFFSGVAFAAGSAGVVV